MFDMGWGEMMVIGVVALVVVGPKELPTLFRSVGVYMGKARGMAREFTRAMEAAADETGVKEIDRQIRAAARPVQYATDRIKDSALKSPPKPAAAPLVLQNTAPGPATAALSAERTEEQARIKAEAAQRALDRARRDQEEAQLALERVRLEREAGAPEAATPARPDETAAGHNA